VRDRDAVRAIVEGIARSTLLIADGHHRYETALAYAEERRREGGDPDAPYNFVLMYLTSMAHPGLVVLPTHRVLSEAARFDVPRFVAQLQQHFSLQRFPRSAQVQFLAALRESRPGRFGVLLAGEGDLLLATLKAPTVLEQYAAHLHPVVRRLDVTVLDTVILRGLVGIDVSAAAQDGRLAYTHDDNAAVNALDQGAQAAFLMNPPDFTDVQAVCMAGQTMPEKSTYFYPKLLTGLVLHPFDE
jgi:uncharacterized protein (DUF1015 family)